MKSKEGPVWPLVLAIIAIYIIAALVEPCDGDCVYPEVSDVSR